jgi:hypothetical protein
VQRAVALARDVDDVLEELACRDPAVELLLGEEVVLAAVRLAAAARTGRRGDRDLEIVALGEQRADERALARAGGARDDEELRRSGQSAPVSA